MWQSQCHIEWFSLFYNKALKNSLNYIYVLSCHEQYNIIGGDGPFKFLNKLLLKVFVCFCVINNFVISRE